MDWISMSIPPEKSGQYLVLIKSLNEYVPVIGYFNELDKRWVNHLSNEMKPSYWMPIPDMGGLK